MILHRIDKSWKLTWIILSVLIVSFIAGTVPKVVAADVEPAAFRIIDVRSEQGQLAIETQHFYPDGRHWFYEVYSYQGREWFRRPRATNDVGQALREDGSIAPYRQVAEDRLVQYLPYKIIFLDSVEVEEGGPPLYYVIGGDFEIGVPRGDVIEALGSPDKYTETELLYIDGPGWKYSDEPFLDESSILEVITETHNERLLTGWTSNKGRVVLPEIVYTGQDTAGSLELVNKFDYLVWDINYVTLPTREFNPRIVTKEGNQYLGSTEELAEIQEYYELVDLRTRDSKSYRLNDDTVRTVVEEYIHFQGPTGEWFETSLEFIKVPDQEMWTMVTHPTFHVVGTSDQVSMMSPEGEVGARWYPPSPVTYERDHAWYEYDGLKWVYTLTNSGIKLESKVLNARGASTYEFVFLGLGEEGKLRIDASGNATTRDYDLGNLPPGPTYFDYDDEWEENIPRIFREAGVVVPRAFIIGNNGERYPASSWQIVDDYKIAFTFDDSELPQEAFPYTIDPTTVMTSEGSPAYGGVQDSWMSSYQATTNYGTSGDIIVGDYTNVSTSARGWVKFTDFSAIPSDAIVTEAKMHLYHKGMDIVSCGSCQFPSIVGMRRIHYDFYEDYGTWNKYDIWNGWNSGGAGSIYDRVTPFSAEAHLSPNNWTVGSPSTAHGSVTFEGGLLADDVQNFINGNDTNNRGYVLICQRCEFKGGTQYEHQFTSTEGASSTNHGPILEVTWFQPSITACPSTIATFFSQSGNAGTHVDGELSQGGSYTTSNLSFKLDRRGDTLNATGASIWVQLVTNSSGDWVNVGRGIFSYDTSSIPKDAMIVDGYWQFMLHESPYNNFTTDPWYEATFLTLVSADPIDPGVLREADHNRLGNTELAFRIKGDQFADDDKKGHLLSMYLNTHGMSYINKGGITSFGARMEQDRRIWPVTPASSKRMSMVIQSTDASSAVDHRPRLTVEYIKPCSIDVDYTSGSGGTVSNTTVSTFYPDSHPESTTFDGAMDYTNMPPGENWRELRGAFTGAVGGSGNIFDDDRDAFMHILTYTGSGIVALPKITRLSRAHFGFDTSALPDYSASCTASGTSVLYPDAGTGSQSWDGWFTRSSAGEWSYIRTNPAESSNSTGQLKVMIQTHSTSFHWQNVFRSVMIFETADLPDNAIITGGSIGLVAWSGANSGLADTIEIVPTNVDSVTSLTNSDYNQAISPGTFTATDGVFATDMTANSSDYTYFPLTTTGANHIAQNLDSGEHTAFMLMSGHDWFGEYPGWSHPTQTDFNFYSADESGTSKDPKLTVNYSYPCEGIKSAQFEFVTDNANAPVYDDFGTSLDLVSSNPGSNTGFVTTDWNNFGNLKYSNPVPVESHTKDDVTYNTIGLNERGLAYINDTGITNFGMKFGFDADNIRPAPEGSVYRLVGAHASTTDFICPKGHGSGYSCQTTIGIATADELLSGDKRPRLKVVHGTPTTALIDASHIHAGGKTIIITLNGSQWADPLTTANKQQIIDGITGSHGAGANNWNEAVRDNIPTSAVTRNSDRMVTITLPAGLTNYAPVTKEEITATVNAGVTDPTITIQMSSSDSMTSIENGAPTANHANVAEPYIGDGSAASGHDAYRVLMKFDLSSIPIGSVITDAEIQLYQTNWNSVNSGDCCFVTQVDVHRLLRDWTEGGATWNTYDGSSGWTTAGAGSVGNDIYGHPSARGYMGEPAAPDRWVSLKNDWHLAEDITKMRDGAPATYENYGWRVQMFQAESHGGHNYTNFYSDDQASYEPKLVVTIQQSATTNYEMEGNVVFSVDPLPFAFNSITPTLASNGAAVQITLSGLGLPEHGFAGSEDVRLIKGGQSDIVCTSVSGTGGASVVVSCPITGAVVGAWDIKATESSGLNDTLPGALTLYQAWSSPVNGGSFTPGGSEYAAFAHDDLPYFTVHAFDEVEKEWGAGSSPPADIPAAAGKDAIFSMDKTRLVVSTASNANTLWAYEFTTGTIGAKSNPASAIVQDINDIDFSTNDNALAVAAGGGDRVYMYNVDHSLSIANFWTVLVATPADIPTSGGCSSVDFSPNSDYLAVGCDQAPYLYVWNITNGGSGIPSFGSKLSDPTPLLPSGPVSSVQFSPDGTQIAVATDTSPYVEVFEFNGGAIGAKATAPGTLPTGAATGVAWSNHNQTGLNSLAVSHASSPYLSVYNFTTDAAAPGTFGDKLDDPSTSLGSATNMVAFHPNDDTLFVGQSSSPYMTAYEYTGHNDDDFRTYRYLANFDTSYLPDDAVITAATLSIYVNSFGNDPATGWDIQVQDGVNGSEPLVVGDNDYLKYDGTTYPVIGSLNNASITNLAWNDITLSAYTAINPTGITQLMLRHENDVAVPTLSTAYPPNQTIGIHPGGSATFPSDCTTALPTAVTSDSQYNLCNSPLSPKLKLQYTSASTGSVGYQGPHLTVDFPDRQEVDEAGGSSDYGTFAITGYQHGAIAYMGIEGFGTLDYDIQYGRELVDTANDWTFFTASSPNKPFTFMKDMYLLEGVTPKADYVGNVTATTNNLKYALTGFPGPQMIDLTRSSEGASDDESTTTMSMPADNASTSSTTGNTVTTEDLAAALGSAEATALADATNSVIDDVMATGWTSYTGIPLGEYWIYVENLVGLPSGSLLLALAFVIITMSGVIAFRTFQSIAAAFICILIVMAAFTLSFGGVIPWWMILVFALTGGIFIFSRRAYV